MRKWVAEFQGRNELPALDLSIRTRASPFTSPLTMRDRFRVGALARYTMWRRVSLARRVAPAARSAFHPFGEDMFQEVARSCS